MTRFLLAAATAAALAVPTASASATYEPSCGSVVECVDGLVCNECVTTCIPHCIPDPLIGCFETHDPHLKFCI